LDLVSIQGSEETRGGLAVPVADIGRVGGRVQSLCPSWMNTAQFTMLITLNPEDNDHRDAGSSVSDVVVVYLYLLSSGNLGRHLVQSIMATSVELWMSFDDTYHHALSIPVDTCQRFAVYPLTWLRYVGYTIYGSEGHISTSPDGPEVEYYQADIPLDTYYYVSQESFLLDPNGMDDRTSDSSVVSIGWGNFRERVRHRDGNCVMTGPSYAEACHIIPHAKGHQYMVNLVNHRHEQLYPLLDDINDTRNGILLSPLLHHSFGASETAFLHTPNFAMTVNDVDLVMQPTANLVGFAVQPSVANIRLTFQHFNTNDPVVAIVAPHNSDARVLDSDEWPPPIIFDVAYGCAAIKAWGVSDFVQFAQECTRHIYYDLDDEDEHDNDAGGGGDTGDGGGGDQNGSGERPGLRWSKRIRNQAARQEKARIVGRLARDTEDGQAGDVADMIMGLWVQNAKKCPRQEHAMTVDRTQEKVQTWLKST